MSEQGDVWIEVNEVREDLSQFYGKSSVAMPQYGGAVSRVIVQFNLTAYVKHMIEQAKQDQ
jgi:hypothetical protein